MRHAAAAAWTTLAAVALLAGCSTGPQGDAVVVRSSNSTTWATSESMAAAAAAEARAQAARDAARAAAAARPTLPASAAEPRRALVETGPGPVAPGTMAVAAALPPRQAEVERVVYFDFDRTDIKDEYQGMLDRRARALLATPQAGIVVEGHADERGGREYNLALGQKRAEAVVRALALLGVPPERLEAVSFGDTRPAVQGQGEQAWSQNRRAELKDR